MLVSGDNLVCPCMIMLGCMAKSHCLPHIVFPFLVQTMMGLQPSPVEEKSYFLGRGESDDLNVVINMGGVQDVSQFWLG